MSDVTKPVATGKSTKKAADKPPAWSNVIFALVFAGVGIGVPGWSLCSMADDLLLHYQGVLAKDGSCYLSVYHGSRYGDSTTMLVDYTAADGSKHSGRSKLAFILWPRDPDESVPCEIHYKAGSPDRYSTTWGFSRLPSRFSGFVLMQTWPLLLGILSVAMAASELWGLLFKKRR